MLRVIGGLFLVYQLASRAANSLLSQLEYSFLPIQRGDFRVGVDGVKVVGKLRVRMHVLNNSAVHLTAQELRVRLSQQGQALGAILTRNPIQLEAGQEKVLSFEVVITATDALDRLEQILSSGLSTALSPITIKGSLVFAGGRSLPINTQLQFFSVG